MRRKIIGIFVCILMISCSTTTFAFSPFSSDEQQTKNQFFDTTPVPLPLSKRWIKFYGGTAGEDGRSVQQTTDGGYIITGFTSSFGAGGVWLIKINKYGNEIWNKTFKGGHGFSVQQTTDGGYIIVGTMYRKIEPMDDYDVWLIKTDENGDKVWDKTFGGNSDDYGNSVQQTNEGGYIITGGTRSFGAASSEIWLIKTDDNGNEEWNKTFGGTSVDGASSVQQTTDGGYIITGTTYPSDNNGDVLLVKTDSNGNKSWEKTFGRKIILSKYRTNDIGMSVQQTHEGGYVIVGSTETYNFFTKRHLFPHFNKDVWLIKTNENGDKEWDRILGGRRYDEIGYSVQQTSDRGYIITGTSWVHFEKFGPSDVLLIKTNRFGIQLWDRIFRGLGEQSFGCSVDQTIDGGYIITGSVSTQDSSLQMLLIKTNNHGKIKPLSYVYLWLEKLFERFPNAFPILRQLIE